MTLSIKDSNELIEIAKKVNKKITVVHQNRFNKAVQFAKKIVDNGTLGKISHISGHVRWSRNIEYYQANSRGKWLSDGGCLMNQCIHPIMDIMHWFLNDVIEVSSYGDIS